MGTLKINMDEAIGISVLELIREHIADIESGAVTDFGWDKATELALWRDAETSILDAQTDLDSRDNYGRLTGIRSL